MEFNNEQIHYVFSTSHTSVKYQIKIKNIHHINKLLLNKTVVT